MLTKQEILTVLAVTDLAGLWKYIDRGLCLFGLAIFTVWLVRWISTFMKKQRELWADQEAITKNLREGFADSQVRIDTIKATAAEQLALQELRAADLKNKIQEKDGELATLRKEHEILLLWSKASELYAKANTEGTEKEINDAWYATIKNVGMATGVSPKRAKEIMILAARREPAPEHQGEAAIYWASTMLLNGSHVCSVLQEAVNFPLAVLEDSRQNPQLDIDALADRVQARWDEDRQKALPASTDR